MNQGELTFIEVNSAPSLETDIQHSRIGQLTKNSIALAHGRWSQRISARSSAAQQPSFTAMSVQIAQPSTKITQPSTEITQPSTEITQPSTEITQPSTEVMQPSAQITQPNPQITQPTVPSNALDSPFVAASPVESVLQCQSSKAASICQSMLQLCRSQRKNQFYLKAKLQLIHRSLARHAKEKRKPARV
ncbi:hypothetical protein BJ741DRAFT_110062 [Chytriomyces cf. hyalinus JEL632]|nr:hypothetical protein BJ741DRAFT_110062 [Chytriomyces cf. hyalinus JEL632]